MLKRIIFLWMGFLPFTLEAQVTINAQLPPAGMVQKDQLWYLVLASSKADVIDVSIKLSLQDAVSGQIVMSANTGSFLLGKGIKTITSRDVQPVTYNLNSPDFGRSYLPMGSYIVCYQLYHVSNKGDEPLGDECMRINIDPLSPPLLNSPENESEVQSPYPQFTWMPPTPFDMFNELNYEILVTEMLSGQSPSEAIQHNTPVYTKSNIIQPYESYPSSFSALDTGKTYAWQVVAKNGLSYAVKTEVWTFKVRPLESLREPVAGTYILLDNDVTGTYSVSGDSLYVKYTSRSPLDTTLIVFTDQQANIIKQISKEIKPGDNYLHLGIGNEFQPGNFYILTITDAFDRRHSLRFRIHQN